jgi:hypothetical protein
MSRYVGATAGSPRITALFWGDSAAQEKIAMNAHKAPERVERHFQKEAHAQDGRKAMTEYESQALTTREKTARLKEIRLAKEALVRSIIAL